MEFWIVSLLCILLITQLLILFILFKNRSFAKPNQKESTKHSKQIDERLDHVWEEEVKRTVELQLMRIRNAVQKQTTSIHKKEIELAPKSFIYDDQMLTKVYKEEQRMILYTFISSFNTYLDRFWYSKKGQLKTVFSGKTDNPETQAGQLAQASHELCHQMDLWIHEFLHTEAPSE